MKKIFSTSLPVAYLHVWLLIFRVSAAAFMLTHGVPKLKRLFSGEEIQFTDPFGLGPQITLAMVVFAEFLCSILIIFGAATRFAAAVLVFNMSMAAFYAHAGDPFGTREKALLFLIIFLTLLVTGAGKYSIDSAIHKHKRGM